MYKTQLEHIREGNYDDKISKYREAVNLSKVFPERFQLKTFIYGKNWQRKTLFWTLLELGEYDSKARLHSESHKGLFDNGLNIDRGEVLSLTGFNFYAIKKMNIWEYSNEDKTNR